MAQVKLVSVTPDAEKTMGHIARVSNPKNQDNPNVAGLLKYCIKHGHWSVFEHATMTVEIETNLAIATQLLRHRSFKFQQFSQRYAEANLIQDNIGTPEWRAQDNKNRQNSISGQIAPEVIDELDQRFANHMAEAVDLYQDALKYGVAKECARFILPQATKTRLYMTGDCRSWIHYISLRSSNGTQKEHIEVAEKIKGIFNKEFPTVSDALGWVDVLQTEIPF